ncbi:hypothetical protein OGCDGJMD_00232 [Cyanobium usitatum str. Tous]|jgi:hypothetical protein|nr:hypothetical protein OGCDGJMD_00232 [Cyanobium usitatum str. Tous]
MHVGIHKTASTYIQHRLKRNQRFLRQQGLLYPGRRRDHMRLVKALSQGNLQPWGKLLDRAARKGRTPLVSAEILSLLLASPSADGDCSVLAQLLGFLKERGVGLHLVAFVRDQPAYLNSRYTQLLKRFYFALPFERYLSQTMRAGGESECDYERLFGEALELGEVRCSLLPFRSGEADPCERLLQAIGVASCADLDPLDQRANAQPGWQAVWIAQRIARRLRRHHLQAWRAGACKSRIREGLERMAESQGWPAEPFQGLSEPLLDRLEHRYGASNDRFASRVWGCSWRELFPRPIPSPSPEAPRSDEERRQLVALADQLLADGLASLKRPDQAARISSKGMRWKTMPPWRWLSRALR